MKKLIIIAQKVDVNDDLLGFFVGWIRELAKHFDGVDIITLMKGEYNFPSNVRVFSLGKEKGNNKLKQFFIFYGLLLRLIPGSSGIFAHMSPIFAVASWPVAFLFGKKVCLWYLHRSVTLRLRIANLICRKIITADSDSLQLKSKKILAVGHGIDIEKFSCSRDWQSHQTPRILSVGRISPIKDYKTLIFAADKLNRSGVDFILKIIGRPVMPSDHKYHEEILKLTEDLGLNEKITFEGFVPYSKIENHYKEADIVVGMTPKGGIDKTILEAMASGALVFSSNETMGKYLGQYKDELLFGHRDPDNLVEKLTRLINWPIQKKADVSAFLSDSVRKFHDLKRAIEKISEIYE